MESRTLHLLEFPKVLSELRAFAKSEPGQDACVRIAPLGNAQRIADANELFRQAREWVGEARFKLASFPPLDGLLFYVENEHGFLDLDALYALKQVLLQAKSAVELADSLVAEDENRRVRWPLLLEFFAQSHWPAKTWSALKRCLGDDGLLKDQSSPYLLSVRNEVRRIHRQCTKKAKDYIQEHNLTHFLQDEFMTISSDRYVLPLKSNFKGRMPGIIHDYSQTGETCYFEPIFLVDLNNELQELKQEEREAEKKVLIEISTLVRQEFENVQSTYTMLVDMDVLMAKAAYADALQAVPLEFREGEPMRLYNARHPLLVRTPGGAQPLDIELEQGQSGLIISGGNAGGKTVSLKTLGVIALMGLSGVPVPVDEGSCLPPWVKIFAFLGDEQSLEDQVSTFTAQITNLSRVWDEVDETALVILDEFGAGTDPSQGAALAQAVFDELLERKACVAAATHFPALKAYALAKDEIRAASVLFDSNTKKPLFRLAFDQVGLSQALDVAREHGLDEHVLKRAENYMLLDGADTNALIERLNDMAVAREKELEKVRRERAKLQEKRAKMEQRYERERRTLLDEVEKQSRDIMHAWQAGRTAHKQAMKEMKQVRQKLQVEKEEARATGPAITFESVEKDARVRYVPWNKVGVILEKDHKRKVLKIDLEGVSLWVKPKDIAAVASSPKEQGGSITHVVSESPSIMRLDLRGQRSDTAITELASFLDKALLGNISEVEIIHGRGTGALRKEVHSFLKHYPAAQSYGLANEEQGGDGMTLVELT